ncbi:MAG: hypothetical protein F6K62_22920 [Sphaerospermopsis sp. SIO1G2]|nr:hypothetical protein [Sphaerospermopsis sp. SIO1G2]
MESKEHSAAITGLGVMVRKRTIKKKHDKNSVPILENKECKAFWSFISCSPKVAKDRFKSDGLPKKLLTFENRIKFIFDKNNL